MGLLLLELLLVGCQLLLLLMMEMQRVLGLLMVMVSMGRTYNVLVLRKCLLVLVLFARYRAILPLVVLEGFTHTSLTAVVQDERDSRKEGDACST